MDDIADILKIRAGSDLSTDDYNLDIDYDKHEIKLTSNYSGYLSDFLVKESALPNLVEFRKGESYSDELIPDNNYIESASSIYDSATDNRAVEILFNDRGKDIFSNVTDEISGTGTPISIWLNKELICAPVVNASILDGRAIITGNFDSVSSEELAKQLNSLFLPYSISIKDYSLA